MKKKEKEIVENSRFVYQAYKMPEIYGAKYYHIMEDVKNDFKICSSDGVRNSACRGHHLRLYKRRQAYRI